MKQSPKCEIAITLLDATSSGQHKFKVRPRSNEAVAISHRRYRFARQCARPQAA